MILATLYFLLFCLIVFKHPFFKDEQLSTKWLFAIIALKVLGCFAYYWIYYVYYPGNFNGDSASTMKDAAILHSALQNHDYINYFRMLFGLHSESYTDPLWIKYFDRVEKWGRVDESTKYFLNDNRTPTRVNTVIRLFSFGYYSVHALVMLIISFIGQLAMYKAFKRYFISKEILLAVAIFILPSVLFWSSGVLKEPIALFALGLFLFSFFKIVIDKQYTTKYILVGLLSVGLFLVLKPYILILFLIPLALFHIVQRFNIKRVALFYIATLLLITSSGLIVLKFLFNRDIIETIIIRQNDFVNLSEGGIYLIKRPLIVRIDYKDSAQCKLIDDKTSMYKIKPNTNVMCWHENNMRDTFLIKNYTDTSAFKLITICPPSGSTISMGRLDYSFNSFVKMVPQAFMVVAFRPLFLDSKSMLEHLASLENFMIVCFFLFCFLFRAKQKLDINFLFFLITVVVCSFLLIGLTTTVMGAIVRYKIPFFPCFVMIPLLFLDMSKLKSIPIFKPFFKD